MIPVNNPPINQLLEKSRSLTILPSQITALGDRGFLARFETETEADLWGRSIRRQPWPGLVDLSIAYKTVGLFFDPDLVDLDDVENRLREHAILRNEPNLGRQHLIPVLYDGIDLASSAEALGLSSERFVRLHSEPDYQVFAIGFLPGFPYAGYLPSELSGLGRLAPPRVRVPAGAVAIAGRQTAIYPGESPGGWRLIGRTPLKIVDPGADYFPIEAGDRLRFIPISSKAFDERLGESL